MSPSAVSAATGAPPGPGPEPALAEAVLLALPLATVVLGPDAAVVFANPAAVAMDLVRGVRLTLPGLDPALARLRADGTPGEVMLTLPPRPEPPLRRPRPGQEPIAVKARLTRLPAGHVCVVVQDVTESRRVESVRRDFVANVSHELKTPVGALSILAEAAADASDDPAAVRRFAARMTHEAGRLARLVQELIDLSRLQGADPVPDPAAVAVDGVIREALDRTRLAADAKEITVAVVGSAGLRLWGDERQAVTAVANLIDNAVAYSPPRTRVVVGLRCTTDTVQISVADEGIGIAAADLERVFERFYRADPARSRATGGTGLGLAIVKHIASNQGGWVEVWSAEGAGSTFTLHLPRLAPGSSGSVDHREPG